MSVFCRHPAASIASLIAVICLVVAVALVWAHLWSASGQTVYGVTSGQSVEQVSGKLSAALDGITAGDLSKADAAIKQAVPAVAAGTTMIVRKRATR
ncbi:hypothetical protein ACR733_04775 [Bifidobacterium bifidum]|uniref:hypothetical protein n=1 Tax=Bifidobacterium bifidum TaxID=1681 RepID=UPI003DA42027